MMAGFLQVLVLGLALGRVADAAVQDRAATTLAYDYIVVGGGTAGLAVATRLSLGLPSASVLVIEAGPAAPNELGINIPGKKGSTLGTVYDWNFTTVAQSNLKNRVIGFNRGKVLGGSSALNLLCYDRASATEYDGWEELGNPGWNWKNMLAAMNKAENFTGINTATYGSKGVGSDGPVKAVVNRWVPAQQNGFIPAVSQGFGLPNNRESLGGDNIGVMFQPSSIDPTHYNRSYSANAYLPLAGSNLAVSPNTRVARIDFEQVGTLHRATGVTLQNGTSITARREVVLSAGTVQSPGILELSGIGQASVIAALNQSQLIDLPGVGENLQDHIRMQTSYQLKQNYTSVDIFKYNATYATQELNKWLAGEYSRWDYTGSGYLFADWKTAATNYTRLVSLAKAAAASSDSTSIVSPVTQKKLDWLLDPSVPEVEAIFSDGYTGVKGYPAVNSSLHGQGFSTVIGGLMHPLGRGSIHINASQPYGNPVINPRYLSNKYDLAAMIEIAKFYRRVARTPPLADAFVTEYEPGYALVPLNATDDVWKQYVLNVTSTIYHPTGTCAMLPREDGGVVDPSLTVYGTTNLRIVDASIFPVQISAHIQTAVYGVAERAAEFIIAKASCSK